MEVAGSQQNLLPYDVGNKEDCSQGLCSINCPQWCYTLFPPPPPLSLSGADDDDSGTAFTPLVISIIAILASALLLVSYYTLVSKYCTSVSFRRRSPSNVQDEPRGGGADGGRHDELHVSVSNGLEQSHINKISALRYKKEEGLVEGTDCSVCLGEFKEEERLRQLPKCGHAFHLQCIDTWLKSHANCPLCRANIAPASGEREAEEMVVIIEDAERSGEEDDDGGVEIWEGDFEPVRRCLSAGSAAVMVEEFMAVKNCRVVVGNRSVRRIEEELNRGGGRNRGLHSVLSTVRMKRSVSSGRVLFGRQGRGRTSRFLSSS